MITNSQKELIAGVATGIRRVANQSGKHQSFSKMAKLTDLKGDELLLATKRMSERERRSMSDAYSEMGKVMNVLSSFDRQ